MDHSLKIVTTLPQKMMMMDLRMKIQNPEKESRPRRKTSQKLVNSIGSNLHLEGMERMP